MQGERRGLEGHPKSGEGPARAQRDVGARLKWRRTWGSSSRGKAICAPGEGGGVPHVRAGIGYSAPPVAGQGRASLPPLKGAPPFGKQGTVSPDGGKARVTRRKAREVVAQEAIVVF